MFLIPYLWTEPPIGEGGLLALEQGLVKGWCPWWEIYHLEGGEQAWVGDEVWRVGGTEGRGGVEGKT